MFRCVFSVVTASVLVCMSACGRPGADIKNVFGKDDRVKMDDPHGPWTAVGQVENRYGMLCTGTLVGRDLVLTAAHCVLRGGRLDNRIWFTPFVVDGAGRDRSLVTVIRHGTNDPNVNRASDWALLRLEVLLGDHYGYLPVMDIGADDLQGRLLTAAGYSGDLAGGDSAGVHAGCTARGLGKAQGLFLHDCDGTPGASGGPMLIQDGDNFFVAGIFVSERRGLDVKTVFADEYSPAFANIGVAAAVFHGAVATANPPPGGL